MKKSAADKRKLLTRILCIALTVILVFSTVASAVFMLLG